MTSVRIAAVVLASALAVAGCGDDGSASSSPTPVGSTTAATSLERAQAALLIDETPPAPPGTIVEIGTPITAEGDEVGSPWAQFMVCPVVASHPDEGPATDVEPDALAGAWSFGVAGAAQLDQYAIVYADEAAAQAAVTRARAKVDECAALYEASPDYFGDPPDVTLGEVPSSVDGFRVRGVFTHDQGASQSEAVSTVMLVGDTVHYARFAPSGYQTDSGGEVANPGGMLDAAWTEQIITMAAENLGE